MNTSYCTNSNSQRVCLSLQSLHQHMDGSITSSCEYCTQMLPTGHNKWMGTSHRYLDLGLCTAAAPDPAWDYWCATSHIPSLVPRPPHPAFVACSTKSGEKAWTDLSRDVPLLTSCIVATHDRSSSNQTRRTNWTERMNWIQGKKSEGERTNPDVSKLHTVENRWLHTSSC